MAIYAIGDVQGCYQELNALLEKIQFNPRKDYLWFTGDLVNRGPESAKVLRFVKRLGQHAITVLGNHDLHLLAVAYASTHLRRHDTFQDILNAPDRAELIEWLRQQPLMHYDPTLNIALLHAGLPPQWDMQKALVCAHEVELVLRGPDCTDFFNHMYGNQPDHWNEALTSWDRLRFITNSLTRLRYCDKDGRQSLEPKGPPGTQLAPYLPWFEIPQRATFAHTIVFGHWASLGLQKNNNVLALDSGCAWGGSLSALRLDAEADFVSIPCSKCADI